MPVFHHDAIVFKRGSGIPVIFQHGMGGNAERVAQPLSHPAFRLLSFDFRGHGKTVTIGNQEKLTFNTFADDVIAFMDFW
jgi:pimeloyl-ACP methyl ester carboxylesterase